jgi:enoyl-CoA hydratase
MDLSGASMPIDPLPIERDTSGPHAGIVTIRLEQPGKPVVVLDHPLIQRLEATLKSLPPDAAGMILASASERVFVAGADLKTIEVSDDAQLMAYLQYGARVFGMVAELPFPTVAAINGAALGGGLELAMHCDALVAAPAASGKPYPVGLPEAGLSLCPGWGGTNLLPARIDPSEAIRRTASGQTMTFDEACKAGLFDKIAPTPQDLIATAKSWLAAARTVERSPRDGMPRRCIARPDAKAKALAALDTVRQELPGTEAAAAVAAAVEAGITRGWAAALEVERRELVRLRHTAPARSALQTFFAKGGAKS